MHPSQLSDSLLEHVPALGAVEPHLLHRYADLMLKLAAHCGKGHRRAGSNGIPHDALAIYCRRLQRDFGLDGFRHINEIAKCIEHTTNWHIDSGETKAYWLNERGKQMIELTRQQAAQGRRNHLLDHNGSTLRKRSNGIYTARDANERNAATAAHLDWAVWVNLDAISMVLDVGVGVFFTDIEPHRLVRTDSELRAIHSCALNDTLGRGWIPQTYKEAESGRLYGNGSLSLQLVTREAKRVALHGTNEYDFENCHYRLLANAARDARIDTPVIDEYLADPRAYRQQLAAHLGISFDAAKTCLLATLYGATQSLWADCAIPKLIGPENALRLYELPQFNDLAFEIVEVGEHMRQRARRHQTGAIINCRGKACIGNPKQELAHLLQGLESALLDVVMHEYQDDILIVQHDGFTMSTYVQPEEIEALLSYETGIEMRVSYEQLTLSGIP